MPITIADPALLAQLNAAQGVIEVRDPAAAEQALASVWLVAADRNAVTAASHRLDYDLTHDPYGREFARNSSVNAPRWTSLSGLPT